MVHHDMCDSANGGPCDCSCYGHAPAFPPGEAPATEHGVRIYPKSCALHPATYHEACAAVDAEVSRLRAELQRERDKGDACCLDWNEKLTSAEHRLREVEGERDRVLVAYWWSVRWAQADVFPARTRRVLRKRRLSRQRLDAELSRVLAPSLTTGEG